jgi:hypothetical protein
VSGIITTLLNFASFGLFKLALKRLGYDRIYHLALWINGKYVFDKQEVLKFVVGSPLSKGSEVMEVPLGGAPSKETTINEMVEKTKSFMGDKNFTSYDARRNNCQVFVDSVLSANGWNNPRLKEFVLQDAEKIFSRIPSFIDRYGKQLTDLAAIGNRLLTGEGVENKSEVEKNKNKLKKSSTTNKQMSKSAILKELTQVEKAVKGGALPLMAMAVPLLADVIGSLFSGRRGRGMKKEVDSGAVLKELKEMKKQVKGADDVSGGFLGSLLRTAGSTLLQAAPMLLEGFLSSRGRGKGVKTDIVKEHAKEVELNGGAVKAKRAPSKWILALKEFNKGSSTYTVPKKGTKEYDEVKKIMASL